MVSQSVHGELNRSLQMVVYRTLFFVCIRNHFIDKILVAGLCHILPNGREQPKCIVGTVCRMSRLTHIRFIVRRILMSGIVIVFYQRQTTAMVYLCRKHKTNLCKRHLRIQMDNTLNILHGIAVAVAVALSAVDKGSCTGPCKGNKALVSIPCIYHAVERRIRRIDLKIGKLCMPVILQLRKLLLHGACCFITGKNCLCRFCIRLPQYKDKLLTLSRGKL